VASQPQTMVQSEPRTPGGSAGPPKIALKMDFSSFGKA
jgi:hypothetical protein